MVIFFLNLICASAVDQPKPSRRRVSTQTSENPDKDLAWAIKVATRLDGFLIDASQREKTLANTVADQYVKIHNQEACIADLKAQLEAANKKIEVLEAKNKAGQKTKYVYINIPAED